MDKSDIKDASYNADKEILNIELNNGEKHQYHKVPALVYQGFLNSAYQTDYMYKLLNEHYEHYKY
ncbi:KTSC domain-containing protein [Abyssisolibacter fermentans]|uniref:KTSC domain-containing protein n=1 Tax=Abyssisolibacter fermentans TaxID=1766203 RepID=UPI000834FD0C|nr:KTSC domain-containing protein [Abyssisolibacter fermentans]